MPNGEEAAFETQKTLILPVNSSATVVPLLRLAGTEDDEDELIVIRGID
ncbi:hypothetical protein ABIE67_000492 [Streptomyces sp. V4I8]